MRAATTLRIDCAIDHYDGVAPLPIRRTPTAAEYWQRRWAAPR
jgi:hypothetical protein